MRNRHGRITRTRSASTGRRPALERLEERRLLSVAQGGGPQFEPGRVLVQFEPGVGEAMRDQLLGRFDAGRERSVGSPGRAAEGRGALELVSLPPGLSVARAVGAFEASPIVSFAEPNWIYSTQATSSDPYYTGGSLWGMYGDGTSPANPYGSQAGEAWASGFTGSAGVYVGVIDTGLQPTHPDLDANVWTNPEDPADGVDNDGNGYVDDIHGWNFAADTNTIYEKWDEHGTHVAGTIGAEGTDASEGTGQGVVGVNWDVTLISAKFLTGPRGTGNTADAIEAVDYFIDLKARHGLNIVALNNSWGGGGYSQGLFDAIGRADSAGILFVAAAGNNGANTDASAYYPAGYNLPNIISVAALDRNGNLAGYSNSGANSVDLAAPGSAIYSTVPGGYASYDGTSMATPHVTGAAALYASKALAATGLMPPAARIKEAILGGAIPTPSLTGKTLTGGRLDVPGALDFDATPTSPPTAPAGLTTTILSPSEIALNWADSANETSYLIEWSNGPDSGSDAVEAGVTTYRVDELASSTQYAFQVIALSSAFPDDPAPSQIVYAAPAEAISALPYLDDFQDGGQDDDQTIAPTPWAFTGGEWTGTGGVLTQASTQGFLNRTGNPIERKAMAVGLEERPSEVRAKVKLTDWVHGEFARVGVGLRTDPLSGYGYNLLVTGRYGEQKSLEFLNDYVAWSGDISASSRQAITMNEDQWYWFRMREADGVLYGKVWADGSTEPTGWTITFDAAAAGWNRSGNAASVNGGLYGEFTAIGQPLSYSSAVFDDVLIDDRAPTVSIASPSNGATVSGTVAVTAVAGDDNGVGRVEFFVDGISHGVDADGSDGWSDSWDTTAFDDGSYVVSATATDTTGKTATASASVTVNNSVVGATSMSVADLSGVAVIKGRSGKWEAIATVTVRDNLGNPVANASVSGIWAELNRGGSGVTGSDGTVAISSGDINGRSSVTFSVTGLNHASLSYDAGGNLETSIVINRDGSTSALGGQGGGMAASAVGLAALDAQLAATYGRSPIDSIALDHLSPIRRRGVGLIDHVRAG
ncbi:S8 family serine peptidase [Tautonia plasticadhaerens]|uniref:Thermophilic serine proteinase n=1 Tax=Tautonia plasticadhaerens TaxID=2527974 RepID=A0A518GUC6_9BACT|nr:S8 family serine peptidase [Tautonia plasticadhaerens]QDV32187.1 Thermophilic serine proteinase precursor [Tautonia plasticadhaerens]